MKELQIGSRVLGRRPTLVLAVSRAEPVLRRANDLGVDVIEFRIDGLPKAEPAAAKRVVAALRKFGLPILATVRSTSEGGLATLSDPTRALLYEAVMGEVDAIDVEIASAKSLASVVALARRQKKTVVLSHHDFRNAPSQREFESLLAKGKAAGADIVKVAATPKSQDDVVRLLELTLRHRRENIVVIAMGSRGAISRLAFPLAGSLLTFTNVNPTLGQIPLRQLGEQLRRYYPA